ncbi:hypothetical protein [Phormidesmis sp. 146-33]
MPQSSRPVPLKLALHLLGGIEPLYLRQIWLGQLPEGLPIELPLLEQSQITASLRQGATFTILMQSPQPPLSIKVEYSNRLRTLGWLQKRSDEDRVDFNLLFVRTSTMRHSLRHDSTSLLTFCYRPQPPADYSERPLALTLQTRRMAENVTFIKLKLFDENAYRSPCQADWETNELNQLPLPYLIPPIDAEVPPTDADLQGRRGGGSNESWHSTSKIETSLSGLDLLAHYESQLMQAGWARQTRETQEHLLWSVWTLRDRRNHLWQLFLRFVADRDHPNWYTANLEMLNLDTVFERLFPSSSSPSVASTESIPEAILWQFLSDTFLPDETQQLWIEQLPSTFPVLLQFPAQTQILGGFEEPNGIWVFLQVPFSPEQVCEQLAEQLINLGWQQWSAWNDDAEIGFETSTHLETLRNGFFHSTQGTQFSIAVDSAMLNCSDVRLSWSPPPEQVSTPPRESVRSQIQEKLSQQPIPSLGRAAQTEVRRTERRGTINTTITTACFITSLSSAGLVSYYCTEMQQAGWQLQVISQNENSYVSLWSFTDGHGQGWQGILSLLVNPESTQHYSSFLEIQPSDI